MTSKKGGLFGALFGKGNQNNKLNYKVNEVETVDAIIKPSKPGVIVTISRQHGSSGKRIGKRVAQKLGIECYYKEVTALAAEESGLSKEFISDINKNAPEMLHELYLSTDTVQQAIMAQDKIIKKIADNGSCVIVGRAADFVLRDYEKVVKVFIHAPKDKRIAQVIEMYNDTPEEAETHVTHSDAARGEYYKSITGKNWADATNYDLCIDSTIGEHAAVDIILNYIQTVYPEAEEE